MTKSLSDQIREAVRSSTLSRYQICRETGIDKASMSKFVGNERGLSLAAVDKLAAVLGLRIVVKRARKQGEK